MYLCLVMNVIRHQEKSLLSTTNMKEMSIKEKRLLSQWIAKIELLLLLGIASDIDHDIEQETKVRLTNRSYHPAVSNFITLSLESRILELVDQLQGKQDNYHH